MDIKKYFIKRITLSIFVLLGLSIVIFFISRVVPGDPARLALGDRASQEAVDALRAEMRLDEPLPKQYVAWLGGVIQGDFGKSLTTKRPVIEDIKQFLPATLELGFFGAIMMVILSISLGTFAARYKNKWPDILIRSGAYIGVAIPSFVLATLLILLFGYYWRVIPVLGRISPSYDIETVTGFMLIDCAIARNFKAMWDAFLHLLCPAFALACGGMFQEARIIRNAMVDNSNKDFLMAHKGYGIPDNIVFKKYLLKPSLIPAISVLGLDVAQMFGGSFLVEMIFVWPGLARYGTTCLLSKDLNSISAVVLITGTIITVINIIVDLIVAYLDPRIRLGGKTK